MMAKSKLERPEKITLQPATAFLKAEKPRLKKRDEPDFDTLFEEDEEGNPLQDIDLIDDLQADADAGMNAVLQAIIERKKATQQRFLVATDPEFFFCICLQSRAQKDEFLQKVGWDDLGDKMLNGLDIARRLGIEIDYIPIEPLKIRGKPGKFKKTDIIGG